MAKPTPLPIFDTNDTNTNLPTAGLQSDGWPVNVVPTSSNFNWLFRRIYLWLKWVDDGIWTAVSLVLSGDLTVNGNSHILGNTTVDTILTVLDNCDFRGDVTIAVGGNLNVNDNVNVGLALSVSGDITTGQGLHATGTTSAIALEARQVPTLINSWVDVNSGPYVAGNDARARYWKDAFGCVHLEGAITGGTSATTAFVLPVGYRPTDIHAVATVCGVANQASVIEVRVNPNGNVNIYHNQGGALAGEAWLDGVCFRP